MIKSPTGYVVMNGKVGRLSNRHKRHWFFCASSRWASADSTASRSLEFGQWWWWVSSMKKTRVSNLWFGQIFKDWVSLRIAAPQARCIGCLMGEKWVVRPQSLMDARILEVMRREAQILEQMEQKRRWEGEVFKFNERGLYNVKKYNVKRA